VTAGDRRRILRLAIGGKGYLGRIVRCVSAFPIAIAAPTLKAEKNPMTDEDLKHEVAAQ
jgi:hypothetical protein